MPLCPIRLGYQPPPQSRFDRRRVLLAAVVFSFLAFVLLVLGRRAAAHFNNAMQDASPERLLVELLVAVAPGGNR